MRRYIRLFIWYEYLYIHAHTYGLITAQPIISMELNTYG